MNIVYQYIAPHSCDYLCEILIKINVVTDKDNSQNETTWDGKKKEIGMAIKSGS